MTLHLGDSLEVLRGMEDNSIDSVVTDPPYGLKFMGKKWDHDVPSVELWREVLRVLKPGGHLLSFGGTRTYHRMAVNIEDAGFEIRDCIQWLYGSGFPKSMDVSKALDKMAGAKREVVGVNPNSRQKADADLYGINGGKSFEVTAPSTPEAKQWQGWGSALKPANEPIVLARKPLEKGLTVAANVLNWGTGGINIDGCRIGPNPGYKYKNGPGGNSFSVGNGIDGTRTEPVESTQGRWPANVIFDEEAAEILGEPSRFFYVAKASKSERNAGLEGMPEVDFSGGGGVKHEKADAYGARKKGVNYHPTVKPIKLMEYLIKLVTPPGGTVLDPFMGSGTTGVAAKQLGREFIGIELNPEYLEIAKGRIGGLGDAHL